MLISVPLLASLEEHSSAKQEGYHFLGAAFEAYNQLGYGMAEAIYQQSLEIELTLRRIHFSKHQKLPAFYKGQSLEAKYIPDVIVFDAIVVELKAVTKLLPEHEAQLFNYMRIARMPVGYLVNLGHSGSLEWKRFILNDLHSGGASAETQDKKRQFPLIDPDQS